eukprot:scaffold109_cov252-Pinguiococcus_pyrenoidosus.AAC.74
MLTMRVQSSAPMQYLARKLVNHPVIGVLARHLHILVFLVQVIRVQPLLHALVDLHEGVQAGGQAGEEMRLELLS